MKLLLINPNTTAAMTANIAEAARAAASPGTEVLAVQPSFGPASIEGFFDEAIATAGVAEQMRLAGDGIDAAVIACFGDPGLDAAREATRAPVLGIAEAAFHVASMIATGFSVVTTMTRTCVIAEHLLHKYGFERRCRGVHGTDIPVLALEDGGLASMAQIEDCAREALARDRSGAIVLGCAGMAGLCAALQQKLGVPVIDGVAAAVQLAQALHGLGLKTSAVGDYAPPLPKAYTGWAAPLGW
ncbi:MAG TPA: aspartate/glutamate racemase family protein [Ideonella sp.]|uniref:aspartate/glutamate racemase family protein n=1 Tax=Ideonella sp. TaxID=1929293 RepID=UPI002C71D85E|nr:aspartate/glutamate racemase family protein [Ideonella sp.]HSI47317.1 aspartate/glutamate racemase family protein [Ideonella sp.]